MSEILKALTDHGVSIWLDDISRERLRTGDLERLVRDKRVVGVTSNPTIFAAALRKGEAYTEQVHDLALRGVDIGEAIRAITTYDIRWACDVLHQAYLDSGGKDGRVSIEVDPRLARDTASTIAEARALWWLVDRPNLFVKIPATAEGLPAIQQCVSEGISINVTLIFSLERYRRVLESWLSGLEQARANGLDLSSIESVGSFFVSRVDTEVDKRLDKIGTPEALALKGKAAVANARLAYAAFEEVINSPRWEALRSAGAQPQRPLWASTGTKNPDYPDTKYVDELITRGVVNTMPEKTLNAVAGHGVVEGDTVRPFFEQAWSTLAALKQAGVDFDDVVKVLEDEGVSKFAASWGELHDTIINELKKA